MPTALFPGDSSMRPSRLLLLLFSLLPLGPSAAAAATFGNLSLVDQVAHYSVDDGRPAVAVQFVAQHTGTVNQAALRLAEVAAGAAGTGGDRGYKLGLTGVAAAGGPGAWIGSQASFTLAGEPAPKWLEKSVSASLVAGSTYFLVLESTNDADAHVGSLVVTAPEVDLVPETGAASPRGFWARSPAGAWTEVPGAEPVFLLRFSQSENVCGLPHGLAEGNPYLARNSASAWSQASISQSFDVPETCEATLVEVLLTEAQGRPVLTLKNPAGTTLATGTLTAGAVQGSAQWYSLALPNVALPAAGGYRLVLSSPMASVTAGWATSKTTTLSPDPCSPYLRTTFQGEGRFVSIVGGVTTDRQDEDAIFRITFCRADFVYFADSDGDGFGDPAASIQACNAPAGYVENDGDCNDADPGINPDALEDCDGADRDCNGTVDDFAPGAAPLCDEQRGVCEGRQKRCGAQGWLLCVESDYGPAYEGYESRCDGLDNDCNGAADDVALARAPACEMTVGACAFSTRLCDPATGWLPCDDSRYGASYQQVENLCDGVDNDCDGETDEDPVLEPCSRQLGVCEGAMKECRLGFLIECDDLAYVAHDPGYQSGIESRCDGLDNDCDGQVDNVLPTSQEPCPLQQGVCAGAVRRCTPGGLGDCEVTDYTSHDPAYEQFETRCDGVDNDCDGEIDAIPEALLPLCDLQEGVCEGSRKRCRAGGLVGCEPGELAAELVDYEAKETRCDGLDNDCDGIVDPPGACADAGTEAPDAQAPADAAAIPVYDVGGCGCSSGAAPLLPLALLPLLALRRRRQG